MPPPSASASDCNYFAGLEALNPSARLHWLKPNIRMATNLRPRKAFEEFRISLADCGFQLEELLTQRMYAVLRLSQFSAIRWSEVRILDTIENFSEHEGC